MPRWMLAAVLVLVGVTVLGCAGVNAYRPVSLKGDLGPQTIRRYEEEYKAQRAAGRAGGMTVLEHSNWWLPGLVLYYRRGTVTRMGGAGDPVYHVTYGQGFGPLSLLYSVSSHATYNAQGKRQDGMRMHAVGAGHLAMIHENDAVLPSGRKNTMVSMGLIHHIVNIHKMGGHTYVSLFTMPNAVGLDVTGGY